MNISASLKRSVINVFLYSVLFHQMYLFITEVDNFKCSPIKDNEIFISCNKVSKVYILFIDKNSFSRWHHFRIKEVMFIDL